MSTSFCSTAYSQDILTGSSIRSLEDALKLNSSFKDISKNGEFSRIKKHFKDFKKDKITSSEFSSLVGQVIDTTKDVDVLQALYRWGFEFFKEDMTIMSELNKILKGVYNVPEYIIFCVSVGWKGGIELMIQHIEKFRFRCENYAPAFRYSCRTCNPFVDNPETVGFSSGPFWVTKRFSNKLSILNEKFERFYEKESGQIAEGDNSHLVDWINSEYRLFVSRLSDGSLKVDLWEGEMLRSYTTEVYRPSGWVTLFSLLRHYQECREEERQRGVIHKIYKAGMKNLLFAHSMSLFEMFEYASKGGYFEYCDLSKIGDCPLIFGSEIKISLESNESILFRDFCRTLKKEMLNLLKLKYMIVSRYTKNQDEITRNVMSLSESFSGGGYYKQGDLVGIGCSAGKRMISELCQKEFEFFGIKNKFFIRKKISAEVQEISLDFVENSYFKMKDHMKEKKEIEPDRKEKGKEIESEEKVKEGDTRVTIYYPKKLRDFERYCLETGYEFAEFFKKLNEKGSPSNTQISSKKEVLPITIGRKSNSLDKIERSKKVTAKKMIELESLKKELAEDRKELEDFTELKRLEEEYLGKVIEFFEVKKCKDELIFAPVKKITERELRQEKNRAEFFSEKESFAKLTMCEKALFLSKKLRDCGAEKDSLALSQKIKSEFEARRQKAKNKSRRRGNKSKFARDTDRKPANYYKRPFTDSMRSCLSSRIIQFQKEKSVYWGTKGVISNSARKKFLLQMGGRNPNGPGCKHLIEKDVGVEELKRIMWFFCMSRLIDKEHTHRMEKPLREIEKAPAGEEDYKRLHEEIVCK